MTEEHQALKARLEAEFLSMAVTLKQAFDKFRERYGIHPTTVWLGEDYLLLLEKVLAIHSYIAKDLYSKHGDREMFGPMEIRKSDEQKGFRLGIYTRGESLLEF